MRTQKDHKSKPVKSVKPIKKRWLPEVIHIRLLDMFSVVPSRSKNSMELGECSRQAMKRLTNHCLALQHALSGYPRVAEIIFITTRGQYQARHFSRPGQAFFFFFLNTRLC